MKIPKKLKVGGKIYTVKQTDNLTLGEQYTGECLYQNLVIHVRPNLAREMREITFIHEMLHAILDHCGYVHHDEKKVEEMANALHMVIVDNPEIFKKD